jgi:hypothetical protein
LWRAVGIVVAGVLGFITRSPTVFVLAAGTLIGLSIHSGEVRFCRRITPIMPVADPEQVRFDPEPSEVRAIEDRIIDWDRHERRRNVSVVPQRCRRAVLV